MEPPNYRPRTSDLQRETARLNGAKSRGPISPEGKAKFARNAETHGLLSNVVLKGENAERFSQISDQILGSIRPQDELELGIAEAFALARWRQRRAWDIESALFAKAMDQHADQPTPLAAASAYEDLIARNDVIGRILRYETTSARTMSRCLRDLHNHRRSQDRRAGTPPPVPPAGAPEP